MLDYAVLGLGFNITAPPDGWPAELQDVAGALFDDAPPPGARAALAAAFLNEFWALYHGVPKPEYLPEYRARQALLGQTVTVTPGTAPRARLRRWTSTRTAAWSSALRESTIQCPCAARKFIWESTCKGLCIVSTKEKRNNYENC